MRLYLRHVSPDGDQGFPGKVTAIAIYRLDGETLWLEFAARITNRRGVIVADIADPDIDRITRISSAG